MLMSRLFSTKSCRIILSLAFCNRIWILRKYFLSIFSPINLNLVGFRLLQWQRPSVIWLILTIVTKINLRVHQNESSKVTCWPLNQCWKGDLSCFNDSLNALLTSSFFKCGIRCTTLQISRKISTFAAHKWHFIQNGVYSICRMAVAELSLFLMKTQPCAKRLGPKFGLTVIQVVVHS